MRSEILTGIGMTGITVMAILNMGVDDDDQIAEKIATLGISLATSAAVL